MSTVAPSCGAPWKGSGEDAHFYSRSAWSLAFAVRACLEHRGKANGVVYLPDYFCSQSLIPLRHRKEIKLVFYPIDRLLSPNWSAIHDLAEREGVPDVFLLVHYFGFPADGRRAAQLCEDMGTTLLEDGAHVLLPSNEIGQFGSAVFYSPHKLLPVPEGGILVVRNKEQMVSLRSKPAKVPGLKWGIWLIKRLVQSSLQRAGINCHVRSSYPGFAEDIAATELRSPPEIDSLTLKLLNVYGQNLQAFVQARRNNYRVLEGTVTAQCSIARPLFSFLPEGSCPYLFPLIVPSSQAEHVHHALNKIGVPAQSWPDLPPEVKERPENHSDAHQLRNSLLTIPVHQGISPAQCHSMSERLTSVLKDENA